MDTQKKTILFAAVATVATTIAIQQISYRNSMEYKYREVFNLDSPSTEVQDQPELEEPDCFTCLPPSMVQKLHSNQ